MSAWTEYTQDTLSLQAHWHETFALCKGIFFIAQPLSTRLRFFYYLHQLSICHFQLYWLIFKNNANYFNVFAVNLAYANGYNAFVTWILNYNKKNKNKKMYCLYCHSIQKAIRMRILHQIHKKTGFPSQIFSPN